MSLLTSSPLHHFEKPKNLKLEVLTEAGQQRVYQVKNADRMIDLAFKNNVTVTKQTLGTKNIEFTDTKNPASNEIVTEVTTVPTAPQDVVTESLKDLGYTTEDPASQQPVPVDPVAEARERVQAALGGDL